jgi:hypothetical protein
VVSPTGFPFKVVIIEGTISDKDIYDARERICDIGFLRQAYKDDNGKLNYRCPAEPVDQYLKKGGAEEDTFGRVCLCNNLGATAGFPQLRKAGYVELPIVTSGDELVYLERYFRPNETRYSASDVIAYLMGEMVRK